MDPSTVASVAAAGALAVGMAVGATAPSRPRRPAGVPGPTPRKLRRTPRRRTVPQPEVKQWPGWGAGSALPPDAFTLES